MKSRTFITVLLLLLIVMLQPVFGITFSSVATISIGIPPGSVAQYQFSWLRSSFYAQGRYWIIYEDAGSCEHQTKCLFYTSSIDGINWLPSVPVLEAGVSIHVTKKDFSIVSDGLTNVFYVRYNETSYQGTCGQNLQFGHGTIGTSGSISWSAENTVISANGTETLNNPVVRLDSNNQVWVGFLFYKQIACGASVDQFLPQVIHSSGTDYTIWTGLTTLSTDHNKDWGVDLVSTGKGTMYAAYWTEISGKNDLHGKAYNTTWSSDEQISPIADTVDTDVQIFANGVTVHAVWIDTTTQKLSYNGRTFVAPSSGTWGTTFRISTSECCSTGSIHYPTPWSGTYDSNTNNIYIWWYNWTLNRVDYYNGLSTTWTGPVTLQWNTVQSYDNSTITSFQYSAITSNGAVTTEIPFTDSSSFGATPNMKSEVVTLVPAPGSGGGAGGGGGGGQGGSCNPCPQNPPPYNPPLAQISQTLQTIIANLPYWPFILLTIFNVLIVMVPYSYTSRKRKKGFWDQF